MTYAIAKVICGCDIPKKLRDIVEEINGEYEAYGFETFYRGSGDTPAFCGVVVGEFDECENQLVSSLPLVPTEQQIETAKEKLRLAKELILQCGDGEMSDEEKREVIANIPDNPSTLLVWSSS